MDALQFETLPKYVEYNGKGYFLSLHITAWDKYCICYKGLEKDEFGGRKTILSVVVEGERPELPEYKIPDDIEDIADAVNLEDAVRITNTRIKRAFKPVLRYTKN